MKLAQLAPNYFQKVMVVSTGHTSQETDTSLTDGPLNSIVSVDSVEYGHLIYISDDQSTFDSVVSGVMAAGHYDLANLMKLAKVNGASHLRLDCDGHYLHEGLGFERFVW